MKFVDGWLVEAKEYNINGNSWDRGGVRASHLVVHGTAGGSDGSGTMKYMGDNGVSTHFAISTNGDIWQGVSANRAAWGNAPLDAPRLNFARADLNPNLWTISVEFCKPDDTNQIDITDAQRKSGFPLIRAICETYGIPKKRGDGNSGIISHADINSVNRSRCPGTFPWDEMLRNINSEGEDMAIVQIGQGMGRYFQDKGNGRWVLVGSNPAIYVVGHIRQAFAYYEGTWGKPLGNEVSLGKGDATAQPFERVIAVYDKDHLFDNPPRQPGSGAPADIYLMHLDKGLGQSLIAKPLTDGLNKQIADKQAQIDKLNQQVSDLNAKVDALDHQLSTTENMEKEALMQQLQDATDAKNKLVNLLKQFVTDASAAIGQ